MWRALRAATQPVEISWSVSNPATVVGRTAQRVLGASPGSRCLILHSLEASQIAHQLGQALRRTGFLPVLSPVSLDTNTEHAAVGAAASISRTGSVFVVACGGASVIDAAKVAAALSTNPDSRLADNEDSKKKMLLPSLPLLLVPAGPGATGVSSVSDVLRIRHGWLAISPAAPLLQACVLSPDVFGKLPETSATVVSMEALAHCCEAVCSASALPPALRLLALHGAVRAAAAVYSLSRVPVDSDTALSSAVNAVIASAVGSAISSNFTLGPARGLARALSAQYSVQYAIAVSALLPCTTSRTVERLLDAFGGGDHDVDEDGAPRSRLSAAAMPGIRWDSSLDAADGVNLPELPEKCQFVLKSAEELPCITASAGGQQQADFAIQRCGILACALSAIRAQALGDSSSARLLPLSPDPEAWATVCEFLPLEIDALACAAVVHNQSLFSLPASLSLGDDAMRSVSEAAEVDSNTLAHSVAFSRPQLVEIMRSVRFGR